MLFEREHGSAVTAELAPGKVTYIPPFWAHRSVNTGDILLVFLWTCSVEGGHDYARIAEGGMRLVVLERDGKPSVEQRAPLISGWTNHFKAVAGSAIPVRAGHAANGVKKFAPNPQRLGVNQFIAHMDAPHHANDKPVVSNLERSPFLAFKAGR